MVLLRRLKLQGQQRGGLVLQHLRLRRGHRHLRGIPLQHLRRDFAQLLARMLALDRGRDDVVEQRLQIGIMTIVVTNV